MMCAYLFLSEILEISRAKFPCAVFIEYNEQLSNFKSWTSLNKNHIELVFHPTLGHSM